MKNYRMWMIAGMLAVSALGIGCTSGPTAACRETVDAFAKRAVECQPGASLSATTASLEQAVTMNRGCGAVVGIRDEAALRGSCLPAIPTLSCSALQNGPLPESCATQIQVAR